MPQRHRVERVAGAAGAVTAGLKGSRPGAAPSRPGAARTEPGGAGLTAYATERNEVPAKRYSLPLMTTHGSSLGSTCGPSGLNSFSTPRTRTALRIPRCFAVAASSLKSVQTTSV